MVRDPLHVSSGYLFRCWRKMYRALAARLPVERATFTLHLSPRPGVAMHDLATRRLVYECHADTWAALVRAVEAD